MATSALWYCLGVIIGWACSTMVNNMDKAKRPRRWTSGTGLQDGLLAWLNEQAKAADVNVEERLAREPHDFRDMMRTGAKLPRK